MHVCVRVCVSVRVCERVRKREVGYELVRAILLLRGDVIKMTCGAKCIEKVPGYARRQRWVTTNDASLRSGVGSQI